MSANGSVSDKADNDVPVEASMSSTRAKIAAIG